MTKQSWTLITEEDPDNPGELILKFPPELMRAAGWVEGDTLIWQDQGDGSWSLTKKESNK